MKTKIVDACILIETIKQHNIFKFQQTIFNPWYNKKYIRCGYLFLYYLD